MAEPRSKRESTARAGLVVLALLAVMVCALVFLAPDPDLAQSGLRVLGALALGVCALGGAHVAGDTLRPSGTDVARLLWGSGPDAGGPDA